MARRSNPTTRPLRLIRTSLAAIEKALADLGPALRSAGAPKGAVSARGRKLKLSPARRAALKLQGEYMGHLRHLGKKRQAEVKAVKAKKGLPAAIALAKRLKTR